MRTSGQSLHASSIVVERGGRIVLDNVGLDARRGTSVGIIGPNGAGKSSLLLALYRAIPRAAGDVLIDGDALDGLSRREIARRVAVVAQETDSAMPLAVRDAVALGRLAHRRLSSYGDVADQALVDAALDRVGLTGLGDRLLPQLSGGERQRALIARAIVQEPDVLLLDEPTNHLDLHHQFALLDLVRSIEATTVIVLHDLNLAAAACQELVLLERGRVVAAGPCEEVLDPDLIAEVYRVRVTAVEHAGRRHLIFDSPSAASAGRRSPKEPPGSTRAATPAGSEGPTRGVR